MCSSDLSHIHRLITRPDHVAAPKGAHPTMWRHLHPFETPQNDLRRTSFHAENDQVGCVSNQTSRGDGVLPPPRHHTTPPSSRRCLEGPLSRLCLTLSDSVTSRFRILVNGQGRDGFALDRTPSLQPTQPHPPPCQAASSNSSSSSRCCCHRRPPRIAHRRPQPRRPSLTIAASSRPSLTTASCYYPQHHAKVVGIHSAPASPAKVNDGLRPLAASRRRCWCRPPSSLTRFPATPQEAVARVERSPLPSTNAVETGREGRFRRHHQRGRRRDGDQTRCRLPAFAASTFAHRRDRLVGPLNDSPDLPKRQCAHLQRQRSSSWSRLAMSKQRRHQQRHHDRGF